MYSKVNPSVPTTMCSLSYSEIYDDYLAVDWHYLLKDIPSVPVLNFVAKLQNRVAYILGNSDEQIKIIREFCPFLPQRIRVKVNRFIKSHNNLVSLIDSSTCFYLYALALQNFQPNEPDDNELDLCADEYETVFKAILYCNQRWTDEQCDGITNPSDLTELSIRVDLPIVEFKYHKDFIAQIFKAIQFFHFVENDPYYKTILDCFYKDNKIKDWKDYIITLFSFYAPSLNNHLITIGDEYPEVRRFFDNFVVNIEDCTNLWEEYNAITYFRDHFLFSFPNNTYLLLNPNLLVDKFYQGLKFMFADTIQKHSLNNKKGKPFKPETIKQDFLSQLGEDFSEPHLMYTLLQKIYSKNCSKIYTGSFLKQQKISAEPDLYLRINDVLYLIEHKDLSLGNNYRYSHDYNNVIRPAICDRICLYTDKKHKGYGQLHYSIENIFINGVMDGLDPEVQNVKAVVPVILTTDRAFSSIGIQRLLIEESIQIMKEHPIGRDIFISQPIVVDFDILVSCGYKLQQRELDLSDMFSRYLLANKLNLAPFNTFVMDNYLKRRKNTEEDIKFATEGILDGSKDNS